MSRKARVRWTHRAIEDLRAIGRYIAEDDPRAARQWVEPGGSVPEADED